MMLIIFDCDGVLIDSEILSARVDCEMLREIGYESTPEDLARRYAGFTTQRIFELIGEEMGRAVPDDLVDRTLEETDRRLESEVEAIAGVHEMLDRLDHPRCVCSNSRSDRLRVSLGRVGLWDRFRPYVYSAREVAEGHGKPAPDIFLYAAEKLGAAPERCLVVEDSVNGVRAGVAAGMTVWGFLGGGHVFDGHGARLEEAGAAATVDDFNAFLAAL